MTRAALPNRRPAEIFDLHHGGLDYTITVGRYPEGRVGEVFISTVKAGTDVAHLARDSAIVMSIAMQHGATVQELAAAVTRQPDGAPAHLAGAVLDELARRDAPAAAPAPVAAPAAVEPREPIGFLGGVPRLSGDICASCGAAAMVRTGTCLTCQACGSSSGGCS